MPPTTWRQSRKARGYIATCISSAVVKLRGGGEYVRRVRNVVNIRCGGMQVFRIYFGHITTILISYQLY